MKLILRRNSHAGEYSLHTDDGAMLPNQVHITVKQGMRDVPRIVVEFIVDDESVWIEDSRKKAS